MWGINILSPHKFLFSSLSPQHSRFCNSTAAAAKSLQSCPTLCDPMDCSPTGSPVPGVLQARTPGVGCHFLFQCMKVKSKSEVAQSCPTLCDPRDCIPPGSSAHGIFQVRGLEWVAISFSNAWKWKVKVKSLSHVRLFATPWTAAYQAAPPMEFSRQEYRSGVPLPAPCNSTTHCYMGVLCSSQCRTVW